MRLDPRVTVFVEQMRARSIRQPDAVVFAVDARRVPLAPLLEEESNPSCFALSLNLAGPVGIHWARAVPTFTSRDYPVDPAQAFEVIHFAVALANGVVINPARPTERDRAEKWLHRQKPDSCGHSEQLRDVSVRFFLIDDRRAEPHVPRQTLNADLSQHRRHVADALRQKQPIEVRRLLDQREEIRAPCRVDSIVEHVRERRAEHALAPTMLIEEVPVHRVPVQRLTPVRSRRAAPRRARSPVDRRAAAETRVARLGIAVIAAGPDLLAAFPRIERVICPFDFAVLAHALSPFSADAAIAASMASRAESNQRSFPDRTNPVPYSQI